MHKIFIAIHKFIEQNRALTFVMAAVYLLACGYLFTRLKFEEDITKLIPKGENTDNAAKVLNGLKFADKITVIIEKDSSGNADDLTALADAFLDSLNACEPFIKSVQGSLDEESLEQTMEFVGQNLPLFLDKEDYIKIEANLAKDSIAKTVQENYKTLISPSGFITGKMMTQDPLGITFLALRKLQNLGLSDDFTLHNGYILTKDQKRLLLFINPAMSGTETEKNTLFAEELYRFQDRLNQEFRGKSRISYFGASLIAVANAKQIKKDIMTTTAISITVLMLILMVYYRRVLIPLILFIPTVFGALLGIVFLYFLKDTISAISLSIAAILIGVTIDYALHILTHYKHNSDVNTLYKDITKPLIMSSTTTAVAFLCLLFVKSEALKDLGIFASVVVVASAVFSLIIIPHLYKSSDRISSQKTVLDKLASFPFEKSRVLLWICISVIALSLFFFNKVGFNDDISQLNYVPQEAKEAEKKLEESTNLASKSLYVVKYAEDANEALGLNRELADKLEMAKNKGEILSYSSVSDVVLSEEEQNRKIVAWNDFWTSEKKDNLRNSLIQEGEKVGFKSNTYQTFYDKLNENHKSIVYKDYLQLKSLSLDDFIGESDGLVAVTTLLKIDENKRTEVLKTLSGEESSTLIIDRQQLNETFLGNLKADFSRLVNFSFVAVLLILFVFFRRLELVLISAIPIGITGLVTAGIMGLFGIELNIFSTIVCTLIFGHGVDFSIFMTSALQKEYTTGKDEIPLYRTSILLAVLTTILAIGALIFAKHPALRSISSVSLIGVFAAVLITFVFYPLLFRAFLTWRVKRGQSPFRLGILLFSILSFTYYGLGGFLISILSILCSFWPGKKDKLVLRLRWLMSKYMKSVLDTNVYLKKTKILNTSGEDFKKPAIFIANHTTFLDILVVGMLHPKTVFLVSDWVYNSPIFGKGVRFSGFYPVSKGVEGSVEHLREKIEEGYSIMVFPEGTRSTDNVVKRFHKGAFYLAEHFNLDILPIVIHGGSEALPKGDFLIRNYRLTVKILDRISPFNTSFGEGFGERTKKISAYFKKQYADLRAELEGPDYFEKILLENYLFKDAEIISEVKAGLKVKEKQFYEINKIVSPKARILHLADDHGEGDLLLVLQEPTRKVHSFIIDEERRNVARNNFLVKNRELVYLDELPLNLQYDTLIISSRDMPSEEFCSKFTQVIKTSEYGSV
jgi:1-acyl-sn-glycerol-3-phosphate acyltransferase